VIVIGTDGIWEARSLTGEQFGKERLREVLSSTAEKPAADIRNAIVEAVNAFSHPTPQRDDITLVVIKAGGH
jgi:sigma-B regulation protein RsbU (phosphoserine phosphatase)